MTLALLRYLAADTLRGQRWMAPALLFGVSVVVLAAGPGPALPVYGATSAALLPAALWLTVAVINSEDPVQAAITTVTAGSLLRARMAKAAVAFGACLPLALLGTAWPVITGHPAGLAVAAAGLAAHLLASAAGLAFGSVLSRPVLDRRAWVVVIGVACCLAEVLVPGVPPAGQLVHAFTLSAPGRSGLGGPLAVAAAGTLVLTVAGVGGGYVIARGRA
jgi:hypothetical protein